MTVYIIAEAGVNHNGSLTRALAMVDCARASGADAVKFQAFKASELTSRQAPKASYQARTTAEDESQLTMLQQLELTREEFKHLRNYCRKQGIDFMASPFDFDSLDFLINELDEPIIKIGSGEITNAPLLLEAASSGKSIILSTGMCFLGEVELALGVLAYGYTNGAKSRLSRDDFLVSLASDAGQAFLKDRVSLLHCTTEYPAPLQEVNLRAMATLKQTFGLKTGFSDHTQGVTAAIAAVALGAEIIEKHFTLNHHLSGPDHQASLEPAELKHMVTSIRETEMIMGDAIKRPMASELPNRNIARKSLVARESIRKGEEFTTLNLGLKRPGTGIDAMDYWQWLGKHANCDYKEDEMIKP